MIGLAVWKKLMKLQINSNLLKLKYLLDLAMKLFLIYKVFLNLSALPPTIMPPILISSGSCVQLSPWNRCTNALQIS